MHCTGLTVPKWMLIFWPKIPQMPQNLSAQLPAYAKKIWILVKKGFHWVSVVRALLPIAMPVQTHNSSL